VKAATRAQRRAAVSDSRRAARHGAWGEWQEVPVGPDERHTYNIHGLDRAWRNAVYSVQCYPKASEWGEVLNLMVRRHDNQPIRSWRDMQRIKSELVGAERVAVEVYPAESALVDDANMYHLWVLPEGMALPFGLRKREVVT
jgi:hypothetical protein